MSSESSGNDPKKLSTAEILARARAQAAQKAGGEAAPAESAPAEAPATPAAAETKPAAAKPAGAPKSTADILAAARAAAAAKKEGGEAAPAAEKPAAAKPAAAGAPKSTADILAAARAAAAAKAGGGAAAEGAAKPAAKTAVAAAAGDAPKASVNEMLAAVRGEKPAEPKPAPAVPPMPQKPVPAAAKKKGAEERRSFIAVVTSAFALGWIGLGGAVSAGVLGVLRFMMPNVLTEPPSKFKVGSTGDFDLGTVSEKFKASNGIWIVHTDKYQGRNLIYALSTVCTHLGCTPSWLEGEQKFKCPCHGSGFYINGVNFEGPAPRPLERVGIRVAEDGMLEVDKSLKFQEEMGQWADPASFVEV